MSIQNRLHIVLKMHNLTASSFADKIGVQRSNVSHVLGGRNKPSLDFLEKILLTFPRVNANWLVTGKMNGTEQEITSTSIASSNPTQNDVLTEQNTPTQMDLNFILDERSRELQWECFRRTDLVRFEKFHPH